MSNQDKSKHNTIAFQTDYVPLLNGDVLAALMLSQIYFWYRPSEKTGNSKLRVYKDGKWWLAKSNKDWLTETGMEASGSRRCITVLERLGVIEVGKFRFNGSPVLHVRLVAMQGRNTPLTDPMDVFEKKFLSTAFQKIPESITESTTGDYCKEKEAAKAAKAKPQDTQTTFKGKETPEGIEELTEDSEMKTKELLKQLMESKTPADEKPTTPTGLAVLWKREVAKASGEFVPSVTKKELGQFKRVLAVLGDEAGPVVSHVIHHWGAYVFDVKMKKGLNSGPLEPTISYLTLYVGVAKNFFDAMVLNTVHTSEDGGMPSHESTIDKSVSQKDTASSGIDTPATAEEILATLAKIGITP